MISLGGEKFLPPVALRVDPGSALDAVDGSGGRVRLEAGSQLFHEDVIGEVDRRSLSSYFCVSLLRCHVPKADFGESKCQGQASDEKCRFSPQGLRI